MSSSVDTVELRRCLGRFATGVTVVTCRAANRIHGATVSAFTAVSLDPPLVLVSLDRRSRLSGQLEGRHFVVNVLAEHAPELALQFAGSPQPGVSIRWTGDEGAPRLADAAAYFECEPWRHYDGGDHLLWVGRVERFGRSERKPLVFHAGGFCSLGDPQPFPWRQSLDSPSSSEFLGTAPTNLISFILPPPSKEGHQ